MERAMLVRTGSAMIVYWSLLTLMLWSLPILGEKLDTPEYVRPCNRTDPYLNECIKELFNHLRPYLAKGIPEINVPSIEPMHIDRIAMENGHGPVSVRAVFSNMTVNGGSNYSITHMAADMENYRLDLTVKVPRLIAVGRYDVTGQVLLFPVRTRGDFWAAFGDVTGVGRLYGKVVTKEDGKEYMKTERMILDFSLGRSRFRIRDYINGDNILGQAMNRFLNQNADEIVKEMKPAATHSLSRHFKEWINAAFLNIPLKTWLLD